MWMNTAGDKVKRIRILGSMKSASQKGSCHVLPVWLWADYLTSLTFNYHLCKMGTKILMGKLYMLNKIINVKQIAHYLAYHLLFGLFW